MKVIPVIMAGGAGTRLWPLSNEEKPKQYHNLSGKGSLLEETVKRLKPLSPEQCVVVTAKKYEDISLEEVHKAGLPGTILAEPRPRNTAAAVLYAAIYLDRLYPDDSIMIVLPADHYIKNRVRFGEILSMAVAEASKGKMVTIGIKPTYPETGYGYIKAVKDASGDIMDVDRFVEKPDFKTAKKYVESGHYYWNSGIFAWKTSAIIQAFRDYLPDIMQAFEPLHSLSADKIKSSSTEIWEHKKKVFDAVQSVSVDKGIMERANNRVIIPGDFGWADLGSWKAIDDILDGDVRGNRTPVAENAIFVDSQDCSVFTDESRVAVVGLSNIVVVQSGSDILVIHKDATQDVRKVVDIVREKKD